MEASRFRVGGGYGMQGCGDRFRSPGGSGGVGRMGPGV